MLDKVIFAQNMAGLCEVYNRELTKTLQNIYYAILKDMQDEDFKQAIKRLLQERVFATFPKPAEILELSNVVKVEAREVDPYEMEARRLIKLVHAMNDSVYKTHIETGISFDTLLDDVKFTSVTEEDIDTLNAVKPHYNVKILVGNINTYQDGNIQLQAFIDALKYQPSDAIQIANVTDKLRIKYK